MATKGKAALNLLWTVPVLIGFRPIREMLHLELVVFDAALRSGPTAKGDRAVRPDLAFQDG